MTGLDASSFDRCDGTVDLRIELADAADAEATGFVSACVGAFLASICAGYFFPGSASSALPVRVGAGLVEGRIEVARLAVSAFAVLGGMLADARRHHDVGLRSAEAIVGYTTIDLLAETGLRPAAAPHPPFHVELPDTLDGNDTLLVEIRFAEPVEPATGQRLTDALALWERLSPAYPLDPEDPTELGGAQRHFNDPRTLHHHEWVWVNADPLAWNLLINLACAWHLSLPVERFHIE